MRNILKDLMGPPEEDPEVTFGPPLPEDMQNALVNYVLFAVGVIATGFAVAECNMVLACIGGAALGTFTKRLLSAAEGD